MKSTLRPVWRSILATALLLASVVGFASPLETTSAGVENEDGEKLYWNFCARCHEAGVPKAPTRNMLAFMAPASMLLTLEEGLMQEQASPLSTPQKTAIVEFLTGRKPSEQANIDLPYCAADRAGVDRAAPPPYRGWGFADDNRREVSSEIAGINRANVGNLELQWVFAFPDAVRARSHPAVAGGAVFVGSQDGSVYALDQDSGCVIWRFRARGEVRTGIVLSDWDSADESADPLLYFGDYLGNVYAVHALTGEPAWQVTPDEHPNATITAAPALFEGRLYVSVSSLEVVSAAESSYGCCTFRGSVVALDAITGKQLWKTYSIPEAPAPTKENARGVMQYGPSGAPVWNTPTIDSKRRSLYVGTGENYSSPASDTSDAIIAMDLDDGHIKWHFQATAGDAWNSACVLLDQTNCPVEDGPDFDFGGNTLLTTDRNGRDLVIAGQKSGIVWALDANSGKLAWKNKVGRGGVIGGVHFGIGMSGDAVIVPISDAIAHEAYRGLYEGTPRPGVYALDSATGDYLWQWQATDDCAEGVEHCMAGNSAPPTTTPELVFSGSLDGNIRAHDAATGKVLWQYNTVREYPDTVTGIPGLGGALEGGAAATLHNGMMFLNSGYLFNQHMPGNVLLAFKVVPDETTDE